MHSRGLPLFLVRVKPVAHPQQQLSSNNGQQQQQWCSAHRVHDRGDQKRLTVPKRINAPTAQRSGARPSHSCDAFQTVPSNPLFFRHGVHQNGPLDASTAVHDGGTKHKQTHHCHRVDTAHIKKDHAVQRSDPHEFTQNHSRWS